MRNTTIDKSLAICILGSLTVLATAAGQEVARNPAPRVIADSAIQPLVLTPDYGDGAWVDAAQPIGLRLSRPLDLQTERLAIVVGRTDLSALFTITPTVARYAANTLPLPKGES